MAEIVKSLNDAVGKGYINNVNNQMPNQQSDIGKIIGDVKDIMNTFKELRGTQQQQQQQQQGQVQQNPNNNRMDLTNVTPKSDKIPVAVLKVNQDELDKFLGADVQQLLNNPNINPDMTLRDIVDKWSLIKGIIRPEVETAIKKIAKAEIEFK